MYIYCDPHAEAASAYYNYPVRQGNDFNVFVCFPNEKNDDGSLKYAGRAVSMSFTVKGAPVTAHAVCDDGNPGKESVFPGISNGVSGSNTSTGSLIRGMKYVMYKIEVDSSLGVTSVFGAVPFCIYMSSDDGEPTCVATGKIYVQKTYGNSTPTSITAWEYKDLLSNIKKSMFFTEFPMSFIDDVASDMEGGSSLSIYCHKNIGYIFGDFVLSDTIDSKFSAESDNIPIAETCPIFADSVSPVTIFGTEENGEDYEFKLMPSRVPVYDDSTGLPTGEYRTVLTLYLNPKSYFAGGEGGKRISVSGVFRFTGYEIGISDGSDESTKHVITEIGVTAKRGRTSSVDEPELSADDPNVTVSFSGNDQKNKMNFDFVIPYTVKKIKSFTMTDVVKETGGSVIKASKTRNDEFDISVPFSWVRDYAKYIPNPLQNCLQMSVIYKTYRFEAFGYAASQRDDYYKASIRVDSINDIESSSRPADIEAILNGEGVTLLFTYTLQ